MCGFFGNISKNNKINKDLFNKIIDQMAYRGPDSNGFYEDDNFQVGFRRLSIIDINKGNQPMISSNKKYLMVFNGEIYNFKEIKKNLEEKGIKLKTNSDTEVLLESLSNFGVEFLDKICGMFAIVLYDLVKKKVYLIRDRLGIKPLFYFKNNDNFMFGSEIKSILNSKIYKAEANPSSISSFLNFRYPLGDQTLYQSIFSVKPGEIIEFENGKMKNSIYWSIPRENKSTEKNEDYYVEKLDDLLNIVVKDHLVSDVKISFLLSGGLDSSVLSKISSKYLSIKTNSYSASFARDGYDESKFALQVSKIIDSNHVNLNFNDTDYFKLIDEIIEYKMQPMFIPHEVALYQLFQSVKNNKDKVIISGEGADEIFGGYGRVQGSGFDFKKIEFVKNKVPEFLHKYFISALNLNKKNCLNKNYNFTDHILEVYNWFSLEEKNSLLTVDFKSKLNDKANINNYINSQIIENNNLNYLDKSLFFFQKNHLPCLLNRLDSLSMAHSVEARVPFCDHRILEFMYTVPEKYKIKWKKFYSKFLSLNKKSSYFSELHDTNKYLLRKLSKKYLPEKIVNRKKLGFPVPLDHWFGDNFKNFAKNILLDKQTLDRGIFEKKYIENLLLKKGELNYDFWGKKIWMLINLELWMRKSFH